MSDLRQKILETLGDQFSVALEGMIGESWPANVATTQLPDSNGGSFSWRQKLNIYKDNALYVVASDETWRNVGSKALAAVGLEDAEETDIRATFQELLTQALSGLARFLTSVAGREVTLESGAEVPVPPTKMDSPFLCLHLENPAGTGVDLFVRVEAALLQSLKPPEEPAEAAAPAGEAQAQPQAAAAVAGAGGASAATAAVPTSSMDLLLDVEMPVSVSFGRTHLPLKEVVKLSTGSIIELNRTITEPVEVIVNNCVIARGEVVVIEGNYGVRIQQIVSRSERLRTLD